MFNEKPQAFGLIGEYTMRLHKSYQYSIDYIMYELSMDLGWLLYSFDFANDPLNRFSGVVMIDSPSGKEADKLYNQLKNQHLKNTTV